MLFVLKSNWQRNFILLFSLFCFGVAQAQVPNAPTNLVVTPINTGGMIEFTAPSNIGGSAISNYEYSTDGGTNWVTPSPAITTSPITISSGLTNCTSYSIKIRAVNTSGSGSASVAASLIPTVSQTPGIIWTSRNSASDNSWNSVTYGNGLFVSVASYGTGSRVMTSPDGITWTSRTPASDNEWISVTYGNGLFVAVANSNSGNDVMTSPDGINWTSRTQAADIFWTSVTYGNGLFVAVGQFGNGNLVMTSPDGITWTSRTPAAENYWTSVTYGNGLFVAVASNGNGNGVMTSSFSSAANAPEISAITTRNNVASVAFTQTASAYAPAVSNYEFSTDNGSTWTARNPASNLSPMVITGLTNGTNYNIKIRAINSVGTSCASAAVSATPILGTVADAPTNLVVTAINTGGMIQFTAPANDGGSDITNYEYSTDGGTNWVTPSPAITTSPIIISSGLTNCTSYSIKLRAVNSSGSGYASTSSSLTPTVSQSGIKWTSRNSASDNAWTGVTFGKGLFVAVGQTGTGNRVMTSTDGINWTSRTSPQDDSWLSVTFGNGLFVAVADNGTRRVMTSTNGTDWTVGTAPQQIWNSVTYGNGLFVAVSGNGSQSVMTSSNGIDWTLRNTPANGFRSIIYGNGLFVAVKNNSVMTSPDGINWTSRTPAANLDWLSVGYGNGLFVALAGSGTGNRVMTSPNGINWTSRTSAADNLWRSITYGDGLFVALAGSGTGNRVMTSPDGVNWTSRTSASDNGWRSVIYGNGLIVAVSDNGSGNRVMTSTFSSAANTPVITSATFGSSTTVNFTQSSSELAPSITNYEYSTDNGSNWTAVSPSATTSPLTITGLASVPSSIMIRAVNVVGNSCSSNKYRTTCTPTSSTETISSCNSYTWHGTLYTASNNIATWTGTNAGGCDSVVTLNLTINTTPATPSVNVTNNCNGTSTLSTTASGTLLWSTTATTSSINVSSAGTYTVTQTVNGCVSASGSGVAAPKTSNTGDTSATACDSFVWYGVTYNASATPTHTFTNESGCDSVVTLHLTIIIQSVTPLTADVLVVSGGGSGGAGYGGGGGGGAVKYFTSQTVSGATTVIVGVGGAAVNITTNGTAVTGNPGGSSSFGSLIATSSSSANGPNAYGGGGGGAGSGGGAGGNFNSSLLSGGTAVSGMGNNGGNSQGNGRNFSNVCGGGGGGAGAVGGLGGTNNSNKGGAGGVGLSNSITGVAVFYGGGGGGGVTYNGSAGGAGGNGGGGAGSKGDVAATNGTANTGGGGGGFGASNAGASNNYSGAGGSGIVIVRYQGSTILASGGTITQAGGYTIHTFYSSGTFTLLNPHAAGDTTATACGSFVWYGVTYTSSTNSPTHTFTNVSGCDSVVTLHLTIKTIPSTPSVNVVNNCNGTSTLSTTATGSLLWSTTETVSPITVSNAGTFTVTQTVNGCVSASGSGVASPKTTPSTPSVNVVNNCNGTSTLSTTATGTLLWSTTETASPITVSNAGTYTVTQTVNGCVSASGSGVAAPKTIPSTPSVNVVNNCNGTSTLSTTATGTLLWSTTETASSITVSSAGTYTVKQTVNGCVSAAGSGVAAPKTSNTGDTSATACGSFVWYGVTYNASATPTHTFTNVSGCDSVVTLHLTIKTIPSTPTVNVVNNCNGTSTLSTTATGTLLWSTTETASPITVSNAGTYTVTQTVNGCVSASGSGVAAPKTSNTGDTSATACGSFVWYGVTYNSSARTSPTHTFTNVSGCDSVVTLHLTINALPTPTFTSSPSTTCLNTDVTYTTQSGQASYSWMVSGTQGVDYSITSGGLSSSSNTVTLKWLTAGSKNVDLNYTDQNGCTGGGIDIPTNGLVGYWPFTGNANDASGGGNNGDLRGTTLPALITDRHGNSNSAYAFTAGGTIPNHIYVGRNVLSNYSQMAVSLWFKTGSTTTSLPLSSGNNNEYNIQINPNGKILTGTYHCNNGTVTNGGYVSTESSNAYNDNSWHHAVLVYDGSYNKLYVDGVFNSQVQNTSGTTTPGCASNGNYSDLSFSSYYLYGDYYPLSSTEDLDDIAIYNRSLSANEVADLYNSQNSEIIGGAKSTTTVSIANTGDTTASACGSFVWYGNTYTTSSTPTHTFTNVNGCDSVVTLHLTIKTIPSTPSVNVVNNCNGTSTLSTTATGTLLWSTTETASSITVSNAGTYTVTQTVNGCVSASGSGVAAPKTSNTGDTSATACGSFVWYGVTYNSSATPTHTFTNRSGCDSVVTLHLTINNIGSIITTTNGGRCTSGSVTLSATASLGATIKWYTLSTGGTLLYTGNTYTTPSITSTKTYYAEAYNSLCVSSRVAVVATINTTKPATPGVISGLTRQCQFASNQVYSIAPVANATKYKWTLPAGWTFVGDSTSNSITANVGGNGNPWDITQKINVSATNECGTNGGSSVLYIIIPNSDPKPKIVSGITNVCSKIGLPSPNDTIRYTVTFGGAGPAYSKYGWTVTDPSKMSIVDASGPDSLWIAVRYSFGSFVSGSISVVTKTDCGISSPLTFAVKTTAPVTVSSINGATNVCSRISNNVSDTFRYTAVLGGAVGYKWSISGASSNLVSVVDAATDSSWIAVHYNTGFTSASINAKAISACGTISPTARTYAVGVIAPSAPYSITGTTNVCPFVGTANGYTYTSSLVTGALSYEWTVPNGAVIDSPSVNPYGIKIKVRFITVGINDSIYVQARNNCSLSAKKVLKLITTACYESGHSRLFSESTNTQKGSMIVSVYPNPSKSDFNLQVLTAGKEALNVRILDMQGRVIKSLLIAPNQMMNIGSELKPGVYFIEVKQGVNLKTMRVVKY